MKRYWIFLVLVVSVMTALLYVLNDKAGGQLLPHPTEGEEDHEQRKEWFESIHRAAPGVDWRSIEWQNRKLALQRKSSRFSTLSESGMEILANGLVQGEWQERGSDNIAGHVKAVDYNPAMNDLYVIAEGGSLWRKNLGGGDWAMLNQDYPFKNDLLHVIPLSAGKTRILTAVQNELLFSDDEGISFVASGFTYPTEWSGNTLLSMVVLNDAGQSVYVLATVKDPSTNMASKWLYRSTDKGSTFQKILAFNADAALSMYNPHNSNDLFLIDPSNTTNAFVLYEVKGATVNKIATTTVANTPASGWLAGTKVGGITVLYFFSDINETIHRSADLGKTWTLQGRFPEGWWCRPEVSAQNPDGLFFGGINAYRSVDGGKNWAMINPWSAYYGGEEMKLHADIMAIQPFRRADGSSFVIVNTHGGSYISNDEMKTHQNLSLQGLRTSQVYDVHTDPANPAHVFLGTQDQGFQRTTCGNSFGLLNFEQPLPGDIVNMATTQSHVWVQYPGTIYYFNDAFAESYTTLWNIPSSQLSGRGWSSPIEPVANPALNEVFVGGGNITVGGGSHIIRLHVDAANPQKISARQYAFNFELPGTGDRISSIETLPQDTNRIYVASEQGRFYTSKDAGLTFTQSTSTLTLPSPLYGACIYGSRKTPDLVWFGGSGYTNAPMHVSTDGGKTFRPMNNGLPSTLVYEVVANPAETLLFAATEAGPFVYSVADDIWHSMVGNANPVVAHTGVEYIEPTNTVRFCTYGRGIWDFKIGPTPAVSIKASGPVTFCNGGKVTLTSSSAGGNQWYKNGQAIQGATAQQLVVTQAGDYSVSVNGAGGLVRSSVVKVSILSIPAAPVIVAEGPTTFCQGDFRTIRSNESMGMRWYKNGDFDHQFSGNAYSAFASGSYSAKQVKNGCASPLSNAIGIEVISLPEFPVITASSTSICETSGVTLTSSTGQGLQWYLNGVAIAGATGKTYKAVAAGSYTVSSETACRKYTSVAQVLTAGPAAGKPGITASGATAFCSGGQVTLTAPASSGYQWYNSGGAIASANGGTAQSLSVTNSGSYALKVGSGSCLSAVSDSVTVTVLPLPAKPQITVSGSRLSSSSATGNQWYLNGTSIAGATNQQHVALVSGSYTVRATQNGCSSPLSDALAFVSTGIVDPDVWNNDVKIFPNPFYDRLTVQNNSSRLLDIRLMDMGGRLLMSQRSGNKNIFMPASNLAKGMYLVSVMDVHKNETVVFQVVKQ